MSMWNEWAIAIGVIATMVIDVWALFLKQAFSIPLLNYAFVGRWFGHLASGRPSHSSIAQADPIPDERAMGWVVHDAIDADQELWTQQRLMP